MKKGQELIVIRYLKCFNEEMVEFKGELESIADNQQRKSREAKLRQGIRTDVKTMLVQFKESGGSIEFLEGYGEEDNAMSADQLSWTLAVDIIGSIFAAIDDNKNGRISSDEQLEKYIEAANLILGDDGQNLQSAEQIVDAHKDAWDRSIQNIRVAAFDKRFQNTLGLPEFEKDLKSRVLYIVKNVALSMLEARFKYQGNYEAVKGFFEWISEVNALEKDAIVRAKKNAERADGNFEGIIVDDLQMNYSILTDTSFMKYYWAARYFESDAVLDPDDTIQYLNGFLGERLPEEEVMKNSYLGEVIDLAYEYVLQRIEYLSENDRYDEAHELINNMLGRMAKGDLLQIDGEEDDEDSQDRIGQIDMLLRTILTKHINRSIQKFDFS